MDMDLCCVKKKEYQEAIEAFNKSINLEKTAFALNYRGLCYIFIGEFEKGISDLNEAIKMKSFPGALLSRGYFYHIIKKYDKALSDFNEFIKNHSKNPIAYSARANLYNTIGRLLDALSDYKKVLELDPDYQITLHKIISTVRPEIGNSCTNDSFNIEKPLNN